MDRVIHHSRPSVNDRDLGILRDVLVSGQLAQGPQVLAFETELGHLHGLPPGVATSSGTAALHLALLCLGIGPGDEVLVPSYVCSAPLHAIYHAGAQPVLVDVDPETGNMDPADLKKKLTAKSTAIIAVHLFGLPANMEEIRAAGLPVIEDCAQGLGAKLAKNRVGTLAEVAVFSFYATKLITSGEGGMLLSSDPAILRRAKDLRDYDKRDTFTTRFNYKMTDLQAALGRSQLEQLDRFLEQRLVLAGLYAKGLASLSLKLPPASPGRVYYRYVIAVEDDVSALIQNLADEDIEAARPIYRPLHRYLNQSGYPGAEEAWNAHLSLPIHPSLSSEAVRQVCESLRRALEENSR